MRPLTQSFKAVKVIDRTIRPDRYLTFQGVKIFFPILGTLV